MKISDKGIEFIKQAEGFRAEAYRCAGGVWTIGYGHTGGVREGQRIDKERAEKLLRSDVLGVQLRLSALLSEAEVELTQGQFDALCSFAFNLGMDALRRSTLWRKVVKNAADPAIPDEFRRWVYAGGKRLAGLEKRREGEVAIWKGADA